DGKTPWISRQARACGIGGALIDGAQVGYAHIDAAMGNPGGGEHDGEQEHTRERQPCGERGAGQGEQELLRALWSQWTFR
ncbi:MAG: hypothetical protein IPP33_14795, partial [Flavobacteriales bacterium]|nr:hypothetical protein [Flavobacteriales bacterium]